MAQFRATLAQFGAAPRTEHPPEAILTRGRSPEEPHGRAATLGPYFHSQILACVLPLASTSNSNTPATLLSRASFAEEV